MRNRADRMWPFGRTRPWRAPARSAVVRATSSVRLSTRSPVTWGARVTTPATPTGIPRRDEREPQRAGDHRRQGILRRSRPRPRPPTGHGLPVPDRPPLALNRPPHPLPLRRPRSSDPAGSPSRRYAGISMCPNGLAARMGRRRGRCPARGPQTAAAASTMKILTCHELFQG